MSDIDRDRLQTFIATRPNLVWYVADPKQLSAESIVEHTLNFGSWQDVQELVAILGRNETARIFFDQQARRRTNYRPAIAHYFTLYFREYAPR